MTKPYGSLLALLGPGLFLIGYNIGTGSVTTMAVAGSRWGMALAWTVVLSCIFTYVGIVAFGQYTLVTGDTILSAIRRRFVGGTPISLFIMVALILAEIAGVAGLMAIIVNLLGEWIRYATGTYSEGAKLALTLILSAALFGLLWTGSYQRLETILAVLVAMMGLCFVATALLVVPSWREILAGLVPGVPAAPDSTLIVGAMAGTTFSSALFYCRSIILRQKGWDLRQERRARFDALTSVVAMLVLSLAVMICAAGALHAVGQPVRDPIDMVRTLEPLAGRFANSLFVMGIAAAGVSSLIPTILIAPWLIADFTNSPMDPKSTASRIFVVLGVAIGIMGPYMQVKPVPLMIITMAMLAVVVPLSILAITVLLNQQHMGTHRNTRWMNVACLGTLVFSLAMSYFGVLGLIGYWQRHAR